MRKLFSIKLMLLYFVATFGATIQVHLCHGSIESWEIASKYKPQAKSCCCEKGSHTNMRTQDCCDDISISLIIDDSIIEKLSTNFSILHLVKDILLRPAYQYPVFQDRGISTHYALNTLSLDNIRRAPLFILYQQVKVDC